MPFSYADYVRDWEALLTAVDDNKAALPHFEDHWAELEQAMIQAKAVKARQDLHAGARQKATQDLVDAVNRSKEAAVKLRGFVKSRLGPKNELLTRFGVAPARKRVRRPEKPAEPGPNPQP